MLSLSPLPPHTCCVCRLPTSAPIFLWAPVTGFFVFSVVHPKSERNFQPLLPTFLQGMFCPRPSRMVPSITHGLILALLASSREREPAHLPEESSSTPHTHLAASQELCPAVGIPALGIILCASQAPAGGEGKEKGRQLGKGKEGGRGGASISNFIINKHFIL